MSLGPLAVDPKYQGKGYGRSLLEELEGLASTQELDCVSCRTDVKVRLFCQFTYHEIIGCGCKVDTLVMFIPFSFHVEGQRTFI